MANFKKPFTKQKRNGVKFLDEDGNQAIGRTKQNHKNECDINLILKQYDRTGIITHVRRSAGEYGDFTEVNEYQQNLNMVIQANDNFMQLPSDIRKRFHNDAGEFFEFATNPDNRSELVSLGLANAPIQPQVVETPTEIPPAA